MGLNIPNIGNVANAGKGAVNSIGNIIKGVLFGFVLLAVGVILAYCSSNQPKLHKIYDREVYKGAEFIKVFGPAVLNGAPYNSPWGSGKIYAWYKISEYVAKMDEGDADDPDDDELEWVSTGNDQKFSRTISVTTFSADIDDMWFKIPTVSEYLINGNLVDADRDPTSLGDKKKELTGFLWEPNATYQLFGLPNGNKIENFDFYQI